MPSHKPGNVALPGAPEVTAAHRSTQERLDSPPPRQTDTGWRSSRSNPSSGRWESPDCDRTTSSTSIANSSPRVSRAPRYGKIHWVLRQSLAWAHRRGYCSIIATDGLELPPLGAREMDPPSSADVRRVIDHLLAKDPNWGTLVAVIAWTGCRREEVAGLQWRDVELTKGSLLIRRSVAAVPGGTHVKGTKTGDIRRIAIESKTLKLLKAQRKRADARAKERRATIKTRRSVSSLRTRRHSCPTTRTRSHGPSLNHARTSEHSV